MDTWATAALTLVSVLAGATLQYLFSRRATDATHFLQLRTNAYIDFIKAVTASNAAQKRGDSQKEREASFQVLEARTRICIYGDRQVVNALAEFWRRGAVLDSPERMIAFVEICQAMRECGSMRSQPVENRQMSQLILGEDL